MLTQHRIGPGSPWLKELGALYERAFPENERRPLDTLINDKTGVSEMLVYTEGDTFVGFISLLTEGDIAHIIYFAVEEALRGRGYGGEILGLVAEYRPGFRVIADLELPVPGMPNEEQRRRRLGFYRRSGFCETQVRYEWRDEDYVILSRGGDLTGQEFGAFWAAIERKDPRFGDY